MGDVLCCLALKKRAKNREKRQQSQCADDSSDEEIKEKKEKKKSYDAINKSKNGAVVMSEDVKKKTYYTAEFEAVGDVTKSGNLTCHEFYRLMQLLRFPNGREGGKQLWHSIGKSEGHKMSLSEYIELMEEKGVHTRTCIWRNMFGEFDWNGTGWASKDEVLQGLENIGLPINAQTRKMVDDMDDDNDGRVSYTDFLKEQLKLE